MLQAVKDYLKITWDDEDALLQAMIERGKAYLNDLTGTELDFDLPGPAQSLLLDYCRYVHNNASEYFESNFARDLLRLQLQVGVSELGVEETTG